MVIVSLATACTSFDEAPGTAVEAGTDAQTSDGAADGGADADTDAPLDSTIGPDGEAGASAGVKCGATSCATGPCCINNSGDQACGTTATCSDKSDSWAFACYRKSDCKSDEQCCLSVGPAAAVAVCAKTCTTMRLCSDTPDCAATSEQCLFSSCPGSVRICGKAGTHFIDGPGNANCNY